jgi:hypothetical protein
VIRSLVLLMIVACSRPSSPLAAKQPRVSLTALEWTQRCADRIELARLVLVRLEPAFEHAQLDVDPAPWNPRVHFEVRTGENGLWWANVARGPFSCKDPEKTDKTARGFSDWRDGYSEFPMLVDRYMRIGADEAWLQADHVPDNTAIAFRREMQFALRECLLDAQGVTLLAPPPGVCSGPDVPDVLDE